MTLGGGPIQHWGPQKAPHGWLAFRLPAFAMFCIGKREPDSYGALRPAVRIARAPCSAFCTGRPLSDAASRSPPGAVGGDRAVSPAVRPSFQAVLVQQVSWWSEVSASPIQICKFKYYRSSGFYFL
ncbi:hypothetical protein [Pseudomonas phage Itty13]|uniref:Uncharacterized protein n=1 Tax=Pseudomonas phage Itty13 TaxID=2805750 RepID=A0A889IS80_9CAUD|nr:hypothetical protein PQC19_gp32 [Pseudomonas phage Itty13]QRE00608.1 hypothetical protein [Pseudomonas phage Itty13]